MSVIENSKYNKGNRYLGTIVWHEPKVKHVQSICGSCHVPEPVHVPQEWQSK